MSMAEPREQKIEKKKDSTLQTILEVFKEELIHQSDSLSGRPGIPQTSFWPRKNRRDDRPNG
jgi:hypothetical protein